MGRREERGSILQTGSSLGPYLSQLNDRVYIAFIAACVHTVCICGGRQEGMERVFGE